MLVKHFRLFGLCYLVFLASGYSQTFTPGNLAVLRVGDGTETLVSSGNTLFIDQYTTAGARITSLKLPDTGADALLTSGTATSEGGMTRSVAGSQLVIA